MPELIHEFADQVKGPDGTVYAVSVYGQPRTDGTWEGWLEFQPVGFAAATARRTGRETSQPNRGALAYWASGVEPVYLDGAFARAK
jgi:hypothetical protein